MTTITATDLAQDIRSILDEQFDEMFGVRFDVTGNGSTLTVAAVPKSGTTKRFSVTVKGV